MTYGSDVALKAILITDWTRHAEMKKKIHPKTYPLYGCLGKHVTARAKGSKYNGVKNDDELIDRTQAHLEETYSVHYSECCKCSIPYQPQLIWLQ